MMLKKMPFTHWIASTWAKSGIAGRTALVVAALFLWPFYVMWLPVDLIIDLLRQTPASRPQEIPAQEATSEHIVLESQRLDTRGIEESDRPVGQSNWPLAVELVRRINTEIEARSLKQIPAYSHPQPKRGAYSEWPPEGTALYKTDKGFVMRIDGIIPRSGDIYDRTELWAYFANDGTLQRVKSFFRRYRPKLGVSDPYMREWVYEPPDLTLKRATYPTREGAWTIAHSIDIG